MKIKKEYFLGDKIFYQKALWVLVPVLIQNTITNVVNMLDNVMVGRIGTLPMSAVAIINQLLFIVALCIFGGLSGAGIFSTQYAGAKDDEGLRHCFRIKLFAGGAILLTAILVLGLFPKQLVNLYIAENTSSVEAERTIFFALRYVYIMLIGLIPFTISQIYASSLREVGETRIPMYASVSSILINLIFNYFLIFGKCGFPKLGVSGAAIATTLSRFAEMAIVVIYSHKRKAEFTFLCGVYKSLHVPIALCKKVLAKGLPLLFNELLWSMGAAFYLQCYSVRGLGVVAAANIAATVNNIFNVSFISIGTAISIMAGQNLGANRPEEAKKTVWRLITLSLGVCLVLGCILWGISGIIPEVYNTDKSVKMLATEFLKAIALVMPFAAFAHASYFTLRSGGKTMITFWFDSGFMWFVGAPLAFALANFTHMPEGLMYFSVLALDIIKTAIGIILIRSGKWISNIVHEN